MVFLGGGNLFNWGNRRKKKERERLDSNQIELYNILEYFTRLIFGLPTSKSETKERFVIFVQLQITLEMAATLLLPV